MAIEGLMGKLPVGDPYPVRIVGIINLSSASFYRGSISSLSELERKVEQMIREGVDCIDIGAQSTRPIQIYGGEGRIDEVTEKAIISKAIKIIKDLKESYTVEFSVDTVRAAVAEEALKADIQIINDISGFKKDENMAKLIANYDASVVLMAARKEPGDVYTIGDIINELKNYGLVAKENNQYIILDPIIFYYLKAK